jgi:uncharacterized DUF497 family protein
MEFEWDSAKAASNRLKHGVDLADAAIALEDEFALTQPDPDGEGEDKFVSLGVDANGRLLVTVFTHRNDDIRIISSRLASRGERRRYEDM